MARFYARLQELRETKEEDDRTTATNSEVQSRNKDRRRIKTALRRLLNERLFPQESGSKKPKTTPESKNLQEDKDKNVADTPMALYSKSKTFSIRSKQDDGNLSSATTRSDSLDKVIVVRDRSSVTADEDETNVSDYQQEEKKETVAYYRRHPLGTIKSAKVSRLYRPATHIVRSHTSLSQSSWQLDGLRRDKTFLQKMQNSRDRGDETVSRDPNDRSYTSKVENNEESETEGVWRRERMGVEWAYNMSHSMPKGHGQSHANTDRSSGKLSMRNMDDLELRRLLEELYQDKKYMDKLIDTTVCDKTENEVCSKLETGRDYLLQRALFWLDKGPLTPRPPTTELGFKLERSRTASEMKMKQQSLPI